MKREFLIDRQGKQFVLYAGLLDEAHRNGLKAIRTQMVQSPSPQNGNVCICVAEVETEKGTFSGIGDASPESVGRNIAPHFIRMAETRAKARALRDAINVGAVAFEELGELDDEREPAFDHTPRANGSGQRGLFPMGGDEPTVAQRRPSAPTPIGAGDQATPAQVRAIYLIGRDQHGMTDQAIDERSVSLYQKPPAELSKKQASHLITVLKANGQAAS
jgi:hypothetical protein